MRHQTAREIARDPASTEVGSDGVPPPPLDPLTAIKLWENPCWLSFRVNFLTYRFNGPVYDWIEARFRLVRPEFVALYATGLMPGVTAQGISISAAVPKNTLSRAINKLVRRGLLRRTAHPDDQRAFTLDLTPAGQAVFDEAMPMMIARQSTMLSALTAAEQAQLAELLGRMVMRSNAWPTSLNETPSVPTARKDLP